MKNQIPEFLHTELLNKSSRPKYFPLEMKQFIIDYGVFYNYPNTEKLEESKLVSLWFRYMKSGITEIGLCGYDGCTNTNKIVNNSKTNGYLVSKGCCVNHGVRNSMLNLYGVENAMHLESSKVKIKVTCLKNHGVDNPMKVKEIRDKLSDTIQSKFGVSNIFKNSDFIKRKFMEKYGVDNPSCVLEFKLKKIDTYRSKYGVDNPNQLQSVRDKIVNTNLLKYGCEHPIMNQWGYGFKEYIWKTGEISKVQGYEPIVLRELEEKGYTFQDVKTSSKEMPKIMYVYNNTTHRYYPDIFIPKENLIIEVKSEWTMIGNFEVNLLKAVATKSQGFDFKLEVR